ncbi:MAG TPA: response regulator transcription factor [Spirochaetota bacterium]|nr:response regulator transcription factor [Spirochaetota bacterium]HPC42536.1 response regulator transcription factor [Spirochaetota bacterium]HPL15490.1 response regulator transcription factor [Spirochaetota bacterium]HQF10176.1 response regulator transcription factor [Spirochaetota bacterium]HQH98960.1 response regulator transcription factor [Spirochaetota bacterium]
MIQEKTIQHSGVKPDHQNSTSGISKVLIVDRHPLLRRGLKHVIEREENLKVIGEVGSADEAIHKINRDTPDLVIIDIELPGFMAGIDLIGTLRKRFPEIKVLVFTVRDEVFIAERAISAGATGYVTKEVSTKEIINAINCVSNGDYYLGNSISGKMIECFIRGSGKSAQLPVDGLVNREFEIFRLIGTGLSVKEIAQHLNLSVHTVNAYKKKIREKLQLKKTSEISKSAVQWMIGRNRKNINQCS